MKLLGKPTVSDSAMGGWTAPAQAAQSLKRPREEVEEQAPASVSSMPLVAKYKGADESPSDHIYVQGLPNSIDDATLQQLFVSIGSAVQWSKMLPDIKGAGYCAYMVQLGSMEEAASAIQTLNGQTVEFQGLAPVTKGAPAPAPGKGKDKGKGSWDSWGGKGKGKDSWDSWDSWDGADDWGYAALIAAALGKGDWGKGEWGGDDSWGDDGWGSDKGKGKGGKGKVDGPRTSTVKVVYAGREHLPSDNLYLSQLPLGIDKATLHELFTGLGYTVQSSRIIEDSQGWGVCAAMVRLASPQEAEGAISMLNNQPITLNGAGAAPGEKLPLKVRYAGKDGQPSEVVYITGVPSNVDEAMLAQVFAAVGLTAEKSKIMYDQFGTGYCAAMATLGSIEEATKAIDALNGQIIEIAGGSPPPAGGKGGKGKGKAPAGDFVKPLKLKYSGNTGPSENLYITGVPTAVDQATLIQLFANLGLTCTKARVMHDQWGCGYSAAMASLASIDEATRAIEALDGQVIEVAAAA